jgi:hypothetical protein
MMIYLVEDGDICGRRDNGHVVDHLITSALILNSTQRQQQQQQQTNGF